MDYPGTQFWVASPNAVDRPRAVTSIIIHTTQGPATDESASVNKFISTSASIHYIVNRAGTITQMVRDDQAAFHTGGRIQDPHNLNSIGIEHVNPAGQTPPPVLYANSAALVTWLCYRHKIPKIHQMMAGSPGIKDHQTVSPNDKPCPGSDWDWDHYMGMVQQNVSRAVP